MKSATRKLNRSCSNKSRLNNDPHCLKYIFDHLTDAVLYVDDKGIVQMMNPASERLLGVSCRSFKEKPLDSQIRVINPSDDSDISIADLIKKRHSSVTRIRHVKLLIKTGRERIVDLSISGLSGCNGKIRGGLVIFHDIKKDISREKSIIYRHKIEAIGMVSHYIAKDFNNWLSKISRHASSLSDSLLPKTKTHDEALKIIETTELASQLVKRLMMISRAGSSDSDLKTETVSMNDAIQESVDLMANTLKDKNIYFFLNLPDGMPNIMADHHQLVDCLFNLFLNAADAMPDGGTITVESDPYNTDDHYLSVRIIDTGRGMSRELMERVTEPSFSTNNSFGMGLSIVRNSVERWGGKILITSQISQGTTVKMTLVASKEKVTTKASDDLSEMSVMIVDDNPSFIAEAIAIFTNESIKVITADSAAQAINIFNKRRSKISIHIIDAIMKCENGNYLANEIMKKDPGSKVVLASGFSKDYVKSVVTPDARGFIQKPFEKDAVMSMYKRLTDKK